MSEYSKGSTWRRWDLHLHTPSSVDYKNKSITNAQIIDQLKKSDVSVAAITDHNVVDAERIRDLQTLGKKDNITILPGIELRGEYGKEPINYIGIFDEAVDLEHISSELSVKLNLNQKRKDGRSEDELYCNLDTGAALIHELGGIVTIHAGTKSNSIECIPNSLPHGMAQKQDIAIKIDIFELGKKSDGSDYTSIVFKKLKKTYPMIVCSDNHDINTYSFKNNDVLWIKANPTFQGLRQIVDEPEDRVWIGEYSPESKEDYRIIDSVNITDIRFPDNLEVNPDLVAIIGSRSSGKSTLLSHIAHAIDPVQVDEKAGTKRSKFTPWVTGFSVNWRDGHISRSDTFNSENRREIIYIPQSYINDLADAEESSDADILKYAEAALAAKGSDFHAKKSELDKKVRDLNQSINLKVTAYFNAIQDRASLLKQSSQAGDKKGVESEIKKLTKAIETGGVQITQKELTTYREVSDELAKLKVEESQINRDLQALQPVVEEFDIQENLIPLNFRLEHPDADKNMSRQLEKSLTKVNKDIREAAKSQITEHGKRKQQIIDRREKLNTDNKSLFEKFTKSEGLKKQVELLKRQKENLGKIERLLKEIDDANKTIVATKDSLIDEWKTRKRLLHEFSEGTNEDIDDVNFKAHAITDKVRLNSFIEGFINQRELSEAKQLLPGISGEAGFNADALVDEENIENSLKAIVTGKLRLKMGTDQESAVKQLFANHEYVGYKITFEGDEYATMTPGKKALVVLKLILESSEGKCPVLIDQPEDDLDSRSIFDQVVPFLREKKKERQIILVSHNANMVVTTDSEQVIVANRHGKDSPNVDDKDFNYLTGSIENTSPKDNSCSTVLEAQGVREHICDILEGSEKAFSLRKSRYSI